MPTDDRCITIHPYFKVPEENMEAFRAFCDQCVEQTQNEPKCFYYGFSFEGDLVFCREGYDGAEGALAHLENIGPLLAEGLKISELVRLEIHGTEEELAKLRPATDALNPTYFTLEQGFRR